MEKSSYHPSDYQPIRGYHRISKTVSAGKYGTENPLVMFGLYYPKGGTDGEMSVSWKKSGLSFNLTQLRCFDDAWKLLPEFTDLFREMAKVNNTDIDEPGFVALLDKCRFKDLTVYKQHATPRRHVKNIEKKGRKRGR